MATGSESFDQFIERTRSDGTGRRTFLAAAIGHADVQNHWTIEAETFLPQSNMPDDKVVFIQRIKLAGIVGGLKAKGAKVGDIEYRLGYYLRDKRGFWMYSRNPAHITPGDRKKLERKAVAEGTVLREHAIA